MQPHYVKLIRGYVTVTVRGKRIESFLNGAAARNLSLWDIRRTGTETVRANVLIRDFFRLRPLLKETGCRVHVEGRRGFPFLLGRLEKRKFFIAGLAGFIIGLLVLSQIVWQVRVEGNETVAARDILQAANSEGIRRMQWKFLLKDPDELSRGIHMQVPGLSWVGVEVQGTRILIKVAETTRPEPRELLSPRHLVASKSAVVTQIEAVKGRPAVRPNTYVRKGDVLISGILGDETNRQTVAAQGIVKGIVWYESSIEVPLVQTHKTYTGESFKRFYLVFGKRALQITGYGKKTYEPSEVLQNRKTLQWRGYSLPVGWLTEKVMEARTVEIPIEEAAAKARGIERAKADILFRAGKDSRFVSSSVLQEKIENGKLLMKVLIQTEESIMEEQALVGTE